jgi:hypothetical protein
MKKKEGAAEHTTRTRESNAEEIDTVSDAK